MVFGQQILITVQAKDAQYLHCNSKGEIVLKQLDSDTLKGKMPGQIVWVIVDAENADSKNPIKINSKICLRGAYGTYLCVSEEKKLQATAADIREEATFMLQKSDIPPFPSWCYLRTYQDYLTFRTKGQAKSKIPSTTSISDPKPLGTFHSTKQQELLLQDFLYVLTGVDGTYIKYKKKTIGNIINLGEISFAIEPNLQQPTCDESYLCQITKALILPTYYDYIKKAIASFALLECGQILHSLCDSLQSIEKEYLLLVHQIEIEFRQKNLDLTRLWCIIQPTLNSFTSLMKLFNEIKSSPTSAFHRGGKLISIMIKSLHFSNDESISGIMEVITMNALKIYFKMLSLWMYQGKIDDPFEDFFIKESQEHNKTTIERDYNDSYWSQKYTIRSEMVPSFLSSNQNQILVIGRNLNLLTECGRNLVCELNQNSLLELLNLPNFLQNIDTSKELYVLIQQAYEWSSKALIGLLFEEKKLIDRLVSLKNFFFLGKGDAFINFIEATEDTLELPMKSITEEKIASVFEMCIRVASTNLDPFKEDITAYLNPYTLAEQLFAIQSIKGAIDNGESIPMKMMPQSMGIAKGADSFCLDYIAKWPMNLILSKRAITKYQLLFRYLFNLKIVEMQLGNVWELEMCNKSLNLKQIFMPSYLLRQKMLHFCKNLFYYATVEVIEPKWHKMKAKILGSQSLEDIINHHNSFLDECLKSCMLTHPDMFKVIQKIIQHCLLYSNIAKRYLESCQPKLVSVEEKDGPEGRKKREDFITKLIIQKDFAKVLNKFKVTFDDDIKELFKFMTLA